MNLWWLRVVFPSFISFRVPKAVKINSSSLKLPSVAEQHEGWNCCNSLRLTGKWIMLIFHGIILCIYVRETTVFFFAPLIARRKKNVRLSFRKSLFHRAFTAWNGVLLCENEFNECLYGIANLNNKQVRESQQQQQTCKAKSKIKARKIEKKAWYFHIGGMNGEIRRLYRCENCNQWKTLSVFVITKERCLF